MFYFFFFKFFQIEPINGYYKNMDISENDSMPYIQCDSKSCIGIPVTETQCTTETIGMLINTGSIYPGICLDEDNLVFLNKNTDGYVQYNAKHNIFGLTSEQYALLYISTNSVSYKNNNSKVAYYSNTNLEKNSKPLIKSVGSIYTYINSASLKSEKVYYIEGITTSYYFETIVVCNIDSCITKKGDIGYYLNSGDDKDTYGVIVCVNHYGCSKKEITESSCKNSGDLIKKQDKYYICLKNTNDNIKEIKSKVNPVPSYEVLSKSETLTTLTSFTSQKFNFKIGNDGSAIVLTSTSLPSCDSLTILNECVDSPCSKKCNYLALGYQNCIGKKDNIIRYTNSMETTNIYNTVGTCHPIVNTGTIASNVSNTTTIHFFTNDYKEITKIDPGMETINMAYKCNYTTENVVTGCEFAIGTFIIDDNIVDCKGYKEDNCIVRDKYQPTTIKEEEEESSITETNETISPTPTNNDSKTTTTTTPPLDTLDDDNKNDGNSGALSLYYNLPSNLIYIALFILTIFIHI